MEVKPGYKRTEVGVLPEDWEAAKLGIHATFKTGPFGSALHQSDYVDEGVPVINPMQIVDGKIQPTSTMAITEQTARKLSEFRLSANNVIIGRRGEMGRCALVRTEEQGWLCGTGSMMIRTGRSLDPRFAQRVLSSQPIINEIENASVGSTMINLNQSTMGDLHIPLPPTIAEQESIAEALGDTDALIESLEQLLTKKRQIKQGAMQELLTGKKRLPGFSGEWETLSLGDLEHRGDINLNRGKVIARKMIDCTPGDYPIYSSSVHSNGLFGCWGEYMFDEELITWSVDGGGHFFYRPRHRFSVTNVCGYLRICTRSIQYCYLSYQLQELHSRLYFDYTLKAHPSVIREVYRVSLPRIEEQRAIASILTDMDAEIAALETKLAKTRQLKQGMMQELLTGRIRLI